MHEAELGKIVCGSTSQAEHEIFAWEIVILSQTNLYWDIFRTFHLFFKENLFVASQT